MDLVSELACVRRRIAEIASLTRFLEPRPFQAHVTGVRIGLEPESVDRLIRTAGSAWRVDPPLIKAVIAGESGFVAGATSRAGARGLMQLMPATAARLGVANPYDPQQNVWAGTRYLRELLDRFGGNVEKAVAAYNAGPAAVEKYGGVPPYTETQAYVRNVLANYARYKKQLGR